MKIALVSYINTCPFTDGLSRFFEQEECQLRLLSPDNCALSLKNKEVDMALMPVGAIPDFKEIQLLPDFCIGADGPVQSVFLFARKPIQDIKNVFLDRHSRTSNGLAKILLRHHWRLSPTYIFPEAKHFNQIEGETAGVVIGDKALKLKSHFEYVYDLSEYWKEMTGLPFAFAVWAFYPEAFSSERLTRISEALAFGVRHRADSALKWASHFGFETEKALTYLTKDIHYHFTYERKEAMALYLKLLASENGISV